MWIGRFNDNFYLTVRLVCWEERRYSQSKEKCPDKCDSPLPRGTPWTLLATTMAACTLSATGDAPRTAAASLLLHVSLLQSVANEQATEPVQTSQWYSLGLGSNKARAWLSCWVEPVPAHTLPGKVLTPRWGWGCLNHVAVSEKHNQEKKKPTYLEDFSTNVSAMFDNHTILLLWLAME